MSSFAEPMDADDVTRHVQADPELKRQMYEKGFIFFYMGKYFLTAKGRFEMAKRARDRAAAQRMGLVSIPGETQQ